MKKILSLIAIMLGALVGYSQAPGILNYQGVARNSVGNVLVNKTINLRLTIRDGAAAGPTVYQESRVVTTNPFGLFNVQVGSPGATSVTGTIPGVNWAVGAKFIQVEIDPNGGTSFINIGTAQLASVPYSLYSNLAGDLVLPFNKTQADAGTLFKITNSNTTSAGATALEGLTNSTAGNANAIIGTVTSTAPGSFSAGVRGINNGTGGLGIGVYGSQAGSGWGVYGVTPGGIGVNGASNTGTGLWGSSSSGTGVFGTSSTGNAGRFDNTNTANTSSTVLVNNAATGGSAFGVHSIISSTAPGSFSAAIRGQNNGTGGNGIGVWATQAGSGWGVLGEAPNGVGVYGSALGNGTGVRGYSDNGTGVQGFSNQNGSAALFAIQTAGAAGNTNNVLTATTVGLGRVGYFENTNAANTANVITGLTNGTGRAGAFTVNNTANATQALDVSSNGAAGSRGIRSLHSGLGSPLELAITNTASTNNVFSSTQTGLGRSGLIQITNAANTDNALEGFTSGTGWAGRFWSNNATPRALFTTGAVRMTGINEALNRILTSDASGNATWVDPSGIGVLTGSGTLNFVPKWTPSGTNLGNSNIFVDATNFSTQINTTSMSVSNALNVSGGWMQMDQGASLNFPFVHLNGIASGANAGIIFGSSTGATDNGRFLYRTSGDYLSISHRNGGASTNGLADFVVKNGNVGIATITPTARLEVLQTGTTPAGSFTINNAANTTSGIVGINTASNVGSWGINAISETGTGFPGEATHAALVAAANTGVGIVTSSPTSYGLHAGSIGNHAIFAQQYGTTNAAVFGQGLVPNSYGVAGNAAAGTGAGGYFTGGTTALRTLGGVQLTGINEGVNRILTTTSGTGQATWEDAATAGIVSGSGTLNYLPKWTPNGTTLGNSQVFDNGTNVGIGTANPLAKLQIISSSVQSTPGVHINNNRLISTPASFMQVGLDVIDSSSGGVIENSAIRGYYVGDGVGGFINVGVRGISTQNSNPSFFNFATKVPGLDFYGVHGTGQVGVMGVAQGPGAVYGIYSRGRAGVDGNLEVDGSVRITDGTEGNGYVLTSDASGNASWQGPVSISVSNVTGVVNIPSGPWTPITQWSTILDEDGGSNYNPGTGEYTIPVTGFYNINYNLSWNAAPGNSIEIKGGIYVNGVLDAQTYSNQAVSGEYPGDAAIVHARRFNAGDKISFYALQQTGGVMSLFSGGPGRSCRFSIYLVHR